MSKEETTTVDRNSQAVDLVLNVDGSVIWVGVVGKRKRIQIGGADLNYKQWLLRWRDGGVYLEPADDVLAFSRQRDRIHLNKAADIIGLREGDGYIIVENEKGYRLVKMNIPPALRRLLQRKVMQKRKKRKIMQKRK